MIIGNQLALAVEPIIREAGTILLSYFHKHLTRHEKKEQGFVTEADVASETYLIKQLQQLIPEAAMFAEESGKKGDAEYCWVIDPLDGTTNFAQGLPYFCISIALTFQNKPIFGMIYQPLLNELFYAWKDGGAYLNHKPIHVSHTKLLKESFILIGLPYAKDEAYKKVLKGLAAVGVRSYAFRHLGAAALDQAYVACGRADGMFFMELSWWDVAAGILLISEAGGIVSTYEGTLIDPSYRSFIAGNNEIYTQLSEQVK